MLRVGITGNIGAGKSLVSQIFSVLNVPVYYADVRAKWLMENSSDLQNQIVQLFGKESFSDGKLNRPFIAQIVFSKPEELKKLNAIVHPAVRADYKLWCEEQASSAYTLHEAALIFESGLDSEMEKMIVVSCPEEERIRRLTERDGKPREEILKIIHSQLIEEEKISRADFVVVNDGTAALIPQVWEIHQKLIALIH